MGWYLGSFAGFLFLFFFLSKRGFIPATFGYTWVAVSMSTQTPIVFPANAVLICFCIGYHPQLACNYDGTAIANLNRKKLPYAVKVPNPAKRSWHSTWTPAFSNVLQTYELCFLPLHFVSSPCHPEWLFQGTMLQCWLHCALGQWQQKLMKPRRLQPFWCKEKVQSQQVAKYHLTCKQRATYVWSTPSTTGWIRWLSSAPAWGMPPIQINHKSLDTNISRQH